MANSWSQVSRAPNRNPDHAKLHIINSCAPPARVDSEWMNEWVCNSYSISPRISTVHLWDHHRGLVHYKWHCRSSSRTVQVSVRNLTIRLVNSLSIPIRHTDSGPIHELVKLSLVLPPTLGWVRPHPLPTDHDIVGDLASWYSGLGRSCIHSVSTLGRLLARRFRDFHPGTSIAPAC